MANLIMFVCCVFADSSGDELQQQTNNRKRQASSPAAASAGAPPSKKVRTKTDKFQESWKLRWTWLTYGGPDAGMHCTKCKTF